MGCYCCVYVTSLFFVCLFFTTVGDTLSKTYIRFTNKTKQVYMNQGMAERNANVGFNTLGQGCPNFFNVFY